MPPQSVIGSNAAIRYLKNYQAHVDYWNEVKPTFQLAFVDDPKHVLYIKQYAEALRPNGTMVVARIWHPLDGGFHLAPTGKNPDGTPDTRHYVSSPAEYLGAYGTLGQQPNIILNVFNEPEALGTPENMLRLVAWFIDYIPLAAGMGCKSVLFNWADRNPAIINGMMDGQFDNVLMLMAAHPNIFYMGLHFYGPDEIVSVLDAYVARCSFLGIKPPVVIGTEFGIDSTGGGNRGYKTWPNYKDIYGGWLVTQVKPSDDPNKSTLYKHIQSGVLGGLTIFGEAHAGFVDFDFEDDTGVKTTLKKSALAGEIKPPKIAPTIPPSPPPSNPPPITPSPFTPGMRYVITTPSDYVNLRQIPSTLGVKVGEIPNLSVVTLTDEALVSGEYWRRLSFGNLTGWVSMQNGTVQFAPYLPDNPSMVSVPIDLLKGIANALQSNYVLVKAILDKIGVEE